MPNVTITVSEELKAQMDNYSEVSWSEICRNAISQYISQRENPTPKIELDARVSNLIAYNYTTGYPTLTIDLRIQNKLNVEIAVDRILATAKTFANDGRTVVLGQAYFLYRAIIGSNSRVIATIDFTFPKEKLEEFQGKFTHTFDCYINCVIFVDGFKERYSQDVPFQIPIDVWNDVMKKALGTDQATP